MNKGHKRYIEKYMKKRFFGKCEACEKRALLIKTIQRVDSELIEWSLCNQCYDQFLKEEEI
jgi:hypothetical protein